MRYRYAGVLIIFLFLSVSVFAQDTTDAVEGASIDASDSSETEEQGQAWPRRKAKLDLMLASSFATVSDTGKVFSGYRNETRFEFGLGIGGHFPVANIAPEVTLWAVPSAYVVFSGSSGYSMDTVYQKMADLTLQFVPTIGYGALGTRKSKFGIEAGVGYDIVFRFMSGNVNFVPTALFEISFGGPGIYRILIKRDLAPSELYPYTQVQATTVCLVFSG